MIGFGMPERAESRYCLSDPIIQPTVLDLLFQRAAFPEGISRNRLRAGLPTPEVLIDAPRFVQLVFQDDDPAGRLDGGPGVDEFADPGCDAQLVAGVAAVSAGGAQRDDQLCGAQGPQECRGDADHVRGPAHGVGGVVVVVQLVDRSGAGTACHLHLLCLRTRRGARCRTAPGPGGSTPSTYRRNPSAYLSARPRRRGGLAGISDC